MKHTLFILILLLTLTSCASRKNLSNDIVYDENAEKYQQALQRSKDAFFATDSADFIYNNLGWAERLLTKAKISKTNMPSVYKSIDNDRFTIELPCWEFDTDEYWASTVVVEHKRLDSALVKAKIQGVDDIFSRSENQIKAHSDSEVDFIVDSVAYVNNYADYIRKAQFACLCIIKEKKKYIVNATIRIPNPNYISDDEILRKFDFVRFKEEYRKKFEEYKSQKQDTLQTEKAEKP